MSTKIFKIESYNDSTEPAYIETKLSVEKLTILIRHIIGTLIDQDEEGEVVGVSLCLRRMTEFTQSTIQGAPHPNPVRTA